MINYNLILSKIKNFSEESDKVLYFGILNWLVKKVHENNLSGNFEIYDDLSMGVLAIRILSDQEPVAELTVLPDLYISLGVLTESEYIEKHLGKVYILDLDDNPEITEFFNRAKGLIAN